MIAAIRAVARHSAVLALVLVAACGAPPVALGPGDHIVIVGNALADRMQHDGWLEAHLQAEFPSLRLVIRNQGFTGDRVDHRPRSEGFPTADEYLALSRASVIFAMFGYNESYAGDPAQFGIDLSEWLDHTLAQDYSGSGAPRVVLFSPIAHEDLGDPNLPDGSANNARLADYTATMEAVAKEKGVGFVDLFARSQALYADAGASLTINGVHLSDEGNRQLAREIVEALRGTRLKAQAERVEQVRTAVLDKNRYWFNRYRATDGNDVFGTRSTLAFVDGQTNFTVLQRELTQLDSLTANRDVVIWAAAAGESLRPDDSDVPDALAVTSNLDNPYFQGGVSVTGTSNYLGGEEAIGKMTLERGMRANLFASEEMFPELVNPVQMGVDTKGRLWVAAWATYPMWEPTGQMGDRLLILPDDNRDGVADTAIAFAYVHNPTGFEFWNGGVVVASVPDLLFLKDTDGDDIADIRIRLAGGFGSADTHHSANSFVYGPDGFIYYQRGIFNISNVETPWSTNQESGRSGMYRFNPRTYEFSFHAPNSPNPHGISFDYWGYHYATDATGGAAYQVRPDTAGTFRMRRLLEHTVRPVPASGILSSAHFPARNQGNFLILNVIAFLGIKQYSLAFNEATGDVQGTETSDLMVSSDPNFRPTAFANGDDGGLYVADWSNAIIGHMQHNIRDPARDKSHGRIYRITVPGRPLSEHVPIDGQPLPALLAALEHPIDGIRHRARVELSERNTNEVIAATQIWLARFDAANPAHAHHFLEGLWVHQQHNVVNRELLSLVLNSPVSHARIAATTVAQMWDHGAASQARPAPAQASVDQPVATVAPEDSGAIGIRTVVEEMRYDVPAFTVRAGQAVRLRFENADYTPHNLVVGEPGSADVIGKAADALGAAGFAAHFVPRSAQILAASKLLNHQQSQVLSFTAPTVPGEYAVLCTFPGHRGTMNGVMKVVP